MTHGVASARHRFSHPLLRLVGYEVQMLRDRRRAHRVVAEELERRYFAEPEGLPAEALADQWLASVEPGNPSEDATRATAARYMAVAGEALERTAQFDAALIRCRRGLELLREGEEPGLRASLFRVAGLIQDRLSRTDEAEDSLRRGLAEATDGSVVPPLVVAGLEALAARVANSTGRFEDGVHLARTAFDKARTAGSPLVMAECRQLEGNACLQLGRHADALACYSVALRHAQESGDRLMEASCLGNQAAAEHASGKLEAAERSVGRALELTAAADSRRLRATYLANLSYLQLDLERFEDAWQSAALAGALAEAVGARGLLPGVWNNQAMLLLDCGESQAAVSHARRARALAEELRISLQAATALQIESTSLVEAGDLLGALEAARRSATLSEAVGARRMAVYGLVSASTALRHLDRFPEAVAEAEQAAELARTVSAPDAEFAALVELVSARAAQAARDARDGGGGSLDASSLRGDIERMLDLAATVGARSAWEAFHAAARALDPAFARGLASPQAETTRLLSEARRSLAATASRRGPWRERFLARGPVRALLSDCTRAGMA